MRARFRAAVSVVRTAKGLILHSSAQRTHHVVIVNLDREPAH